MSWKSNFKSGRITQYYCRNDTVKSAQIRSNDITKQIFDVKKATINNRTRDRIINIVYYWSLCYNVVGKRYGRNNEKLYFLTLTFPAGTGDALESKRKCLNYFLIICQRSFSKFLYLWRIERQKNGRLHYHLITNECFEKNKLREEWNRVLSINGYISEYRNISKLKHINGFFYDKSMFQYSEEQQYQWYLYGEKTNWSNPNTTHVQEINEPLHASKYIAKYTAKNGNDTTIDGRLWGCSDKLRNLVPFAFDMGKDKSLIERKLAHRKYEVFEVNQWCRVFLIHDILLALHHRSKIRREFELHLYNLYFNNLY